MTEAAGIITYTTSRSKHVDAAGIVVPNCQVKIVDTTSGENLGPNKNGELYIKSPAMMIGYYKNPNETKQAFDADGNCFNFTYKNRKVIISFFFLQ